MTSLYCVSDTSQLLNFIELVTSMTSIVLCVSDTSQLLNFIELVTFDVNSCIVC